MSRRPIQPHETLDSELSGEVAAIRRGDQFASKTVFGFWVYLMTDCVLFASLFITYAVLRHNTNGGADSHQLFHMRYVLVETILLLTSSLSAGLGQLAARRGQRTAVLGLFSLTFLLGAGFLGLELHEFSQLVADGNSWRASGFLSAFFTLVGTHGAHISAGLLWMAVLLLTTLKRGLTPLLVKRFTLLSLFWHLLDIVWIFIFTIVYGLGVI